MQCASLQVFRFASTHYFYYLQKYCLANLFVQRMQYVNRLLHPSEDFYLRLLQILRLRCLCLRPISNHPVILDVNL